MNGVIALKEHDMIMSIPVALFAFNYFQLLKSVSCLNNIYL